MVLLSTKTNVKPDGYENIVNFMLRKLFIRSIVKNPDINMFKSYKNLYTTMPSLRIKVLIIIRK